MIKWIFVFLINFSHAQSGFSERGMLPMNHQWSECSMGGPVIECKVEECASKCEELNQQAKAEKEAEKEERIQDMIFESQDQDSFQKNPALIQTQ